MKNLKRIVSMLLVIAMLAAIPVVASAAGVTVTHEHKFEWNRTISTRGFSADRVDEFKCTVDGCNYVYSVTVLPSVKKYPTEVTVVPGEEEERSGNVVIPYGYYDGSIYHELYAVLKGCEHTHTNEVVVKNADCDNPGFKYYECADSKCGYKTGFAHIEPTGHVWGDWGYTADGGKAYNKPSEPKMDKTGIATRKCEKCGVVDGAPMPRVGTAKKLVVKGTSKDVIPVYASTSDASDPNKAPLGYVKGGTVAYSIGTAPGFYELYAEQSAWIKEADVTATDVTAADFTSCTHNYVEVFVKEADCESMGYLTLQCMKNTCNGLTFSTSKALEHKWSDAVILEADKATSTTDGYRRYYCVRTNGDGQYIHFSDSFTFEDANKISKTTILANPAKYPYIALEKITDAAKTYSIVTTKTAPTAVYDSSAATRKVEGYLPAGTKLPQLGKSTDSKYILVDERGYWVAAADLTGIDSDSKGATLDHCGSHNLAQAYIKPATCDTVGYLTLKCTNTNCAYFAFDTYKELGHEWDSGRVVKAATSSEEGLRASYCLRKDEKGNYVHSDPKTNDLVVYTKQMDDICQNHADKLYFYDFIKAEAIKTTSEAFREGDVAKKELTAVDSNGLKHDVVGVWYNIDSTKVLAGYAPVGTHFTIYAESTDGEWLCIDASADNGLWIKKANVNNITEPKEQTYCDHTTSKYVVRFPASCENPEFITTYCAQCKRIAIAQGVDALGHDWGEWVTTKAPTKNAEGTETRTCKRKDCTGKETRQIPAVSEALKNSIAYVSGGDIINVYDGASDSHKLIGYATMGATLTVVNFTEDGTWVQVTGKAATGEDPATAFGLSSATKLWVRRADITLGNAVNVASPYAGATEFGYVGTKNEVKVYQMAMITSGYLSSLPSGSAVGVYQYCHGKAYDQIPSADPAATEWARISASEQKWVRYDQLKQKDSSGNYSLLPVLLTQQFIPKTNTVVENDTNAKPIATGHITTTIGLKIRKSPTISSDEIGFLKYETFSTADEPVKIYEIQTVNGVEWGLIKKDTQPALNEQTGWICLTYVSYELEETTPTTGGEVEEIHALTGKVSTGGINLNVRKAADVTSDKVGALANSTKVTIYDTQKAGNGVEWGRISQDKIDGWVCMQYITLDPVASTTPGGTAVAAKVNATVANCATAVNVRNKSDISGAQVAKIPVGTRIAVTKLENGWGYVDGKGWVYLQYVALDAGAEEAIKNPATTTPVTNDEKPVTTYTAVTVTAKIKSDVKVYAQAGGKEIGTNNNELMTLKKDEKVTLVDRTKVHSKVWYKVADGGWVDGTALDMEKVTGTVADSTINVYERASVDSPVVGVLGAGSKVTVIDQSGDSVYAWGQIGTNQWIQLHNVQLDSVYYAAYTPNYKNYPSISGAVIKATDMYEEPESTKIITTLGVNTLVTVQDWKGTLTGGKYVTWGKVTNGSYTGWIKLSEFVGNNETVYVEQNSVAAKVTADVVNLYNKCDNGDIALTLRTGATVTVTEIRLVNTAVWGRMVAATDTKKTELWANLSGFQLNGQTVAATTPVTPAPTLPSAPTTVAPVTVTIGIVAAPAGYNEVNVRAEPHATSAKVTALRNGAQVKVSQQVTSDGAAWAKIDEGWMAMQYINLQAGTVVNANGSATVTGTTIMTTVPTGAIAAGFTSIDNLAVRSSAGVGMPQVKTLAKGSSVVIKSVTQANGLYWGQIDEGWICMSYVTVTAIGSGNAGTAGVIGRCFYTANIRSAAGVANGITAKVMVSANVRIYETTVVSGETWGRTDLGWISMQYVVTE